MSTIPYGRQDINQSDIDAVLDVLHSEYLTQGSVVPAFESRIATYCNVQHAIATNSATSALHIACLALGIGKGDVVWTSPNTFVASANCALYCGATVDFVDIDPHTYNISVERLTEKLVQAEKSGSLPKAVIPVHFSGQSCDMASIHALSQQYDFRIIEDGSHAVGGKYKGEPVGNCRYSDITVFSFHPIKIITTGEGGMATTNNATLAKRLGRFRSHGVESLTLDSQLHPIQEIWNYQQIDLGFNYRMTDIHAALGLSQMKRLDEFVMRRNDIAKRYDQLLSDLPVVIPWQCPDSHSSYHLYVIRLQLNEIRKTQRQVYEALRVAGLLVNLHYIPVYRQPYYEKMGFIAGYCPQAESYFQEAISIPMYPGLTKKQQDRIVVAIREAISI